MKTFVIGGLVIALAILGFYAYQQRQTENVPANPMPTLTQEKHDFCGSANLQALLAMDPGAGNIYGNLTIKNLSDKSCQIIGSNFIKPSYVIANVSTAKFGEPGPKIITLAPGQTVYSEVHYPNGPQCSSNVLTKKISFTYQISPYTEITFNDTNAIVQQDIAVCQSIDEITNVDVWSLSRQPLQ